MSPSTITDVEKVYQRDTVARTAYHRFSKAVLRELCETKGISVANTGLRSHIPTKPDYIKALLSCPHRLQKRVTQREVDVEMTSIEPSACKEGEPEVLQSLDVGDTGAVMEPECLPQPGRFLAEGHESLAESSSMAVNETETSPLPFTPPVRIRLYRDVKAWHYLREILFYRDLEGNINLHELKSELAVDRQLHILEPHRRRPFFNYTPGILHADDVDALLADGFLRVTYGSANPKMAARS